MSLSAIQGITMSTVKTEMEASTPAQALWLQDWEANKSSEVDENGVVGMTFLGDPVLVSLPNKKIHSFATGLNSRVHHKWFDPSTSKWSSWVNMGYLCNGAPVAAIFDNDRVAVFTIGFDRLLQAGLKSKTSDTSFDWKAFPDAKKLQSGSLSAIRMNTAIAFVAVEQFSGKVLMSWLGANGGFDTAWTTVGQNSTILCTSKPVMIQIADGVMEIFIFAQDYTMKRMAYRANVSGWNGTWLGVGDEFQFLHHPTAFSPPLSPGRIDVFTIGNDSMLYQYSATITGSAVGTLVRTALGGASISTPMTSIISPGIFAVTTQKAKGVWQQKFFEASTGVWTPKDGMTEVSSV